MIAIGAFSPLVGFMGKADFEGVCKNMRLASGVVWPIPVTLCPPRAAASWATLAPFVDGAVLLSGLAARRIVRPLAKQHR